MTTKIDCTYSLGAQTPNYEYICARSNKKQTISRTKSGVDSGSTAHLHTDPWDLFCFTGILWGQLDESYGVQ